MEIERLFPRAWINACRAEEVPDVGSYVELIVGDKSIVVVRTDAHRLPGVPASPRVTGEERYPL